MKRLIVLVFMLLACGLWAYAQGSYPSQSSQSGQSSTQSQANSNQTSVRGCLSGSSGSYTLAADSGTTYQLSGDTSKLTKHVGHEVEITGTTSTSSASSGTGSTASNSSAGSSQPTLDVSSVKHISETCKSSSKDMQH